MVKNLKQLMKKVLIITSHFPPSNLAGIHRSRLFAQHLQSFGWEPIVLTVDEKYHEEPPDLNIMKLLPPDLRIEKVKAFELSRFRMIGDLGLRAFFQLYSKAVKLVKQEKIDFVFIIIPSFYTALLGRLVHWKTGVPYGVDYMDPWVHIFPGSDRKFSRQWWSTKLAPILENIAVKKASLITGVAEGYYKGVADRYPHLKENSVFGAMPVGGEKEDHRKVQKLNLQPYLFEKKPGKIQMVYAGTMWPPALPVINAVFQSIAENPDTFRDVEFHFIGTYVSVNDPQGYMQPIAEKWGIWKKQVFEYPNRIPYMDALIHLDGASGIFIFGSVQPHYTPSKVYQAVLSEKPILSVLHSRSTAVAIVRNSGAGVVFDFNGEQDVERIRKEFANKFSEYAGMLENWNPGNVKHSILEQYSAKKVTEKLAKVLQQAYEKAV
jgi:hypothetical protein